MHIRLVRGSLAVALALGVATGFVGCGGSGKTIGAVSGKVTYKGQPVTEGTVSFVETKAGEGAEATLGPDGMFKVVTPDGGLPVGTYAVSISPPIYLDSSDPKTPPVMVAKKVANIPAKYHNHYSSGLTLTVKEGPNEANFEMK